MGNFSKRVDVNQKALTALWRGMGVSVWITSSLGKGAPDVVLGFTDDRGRQVDLLVEIKDGSKPKSARKLTFDEAIFHEKWKGQICIISTEEEAMLIVNAQR